jgi:hypothetical protein
VQVKKKEEVDILCIQGGNHSNQDRKVIFFFESTVTLKGNLPE